MYLGIDIGTSAVKVVLVEESQQIIGDVSQKLSVSRPHPLWSEQDPADWCAAIEHALEQLQKRYPSELARVIGIGLSGQMHGATLVDRKGAPLRSCILWNDGRAAQEGEMLENACPRSREITGNLAMAGFTAPKLLWVRQHEPEVFKAIHKVLLPKDYVRYWLSGEYISDMSDSAGTLWLDVNSRDWSESMLEATHLNQRQMPELIEGSQPGGQLRADLTRRWGITKPPVIAGGGGDNAASACGIGAVNPGDAFISLGSSGVIFVCNDRFLPNTDGAVHTFCHALPGRWHQMGVTLCAAACFDWLAAATHSTTPDVFKDLDAIAQGPSELFFLPYLSGERTPHNNPSLRAAFIGLTLDADRVALSHAVAQGVGFAFRDNLKVLRDAGTRIDVLMAVGGGTRSTAWLQMLASILDLPIQLPKQGDRGAAFGAARLAILAATGADPGVVCQAPEILKTFAPDEAMVEYYGEKWQRFRAMYPALKEALAI